MYTVEITDKKFDKAARQVVLDVRFQNGSTVIDERIPYGADLTPDAIKRNLKLRAQMLTDGDVNGAAIETGPVDLESVPEDDRPTEQREFDEWFRDFSRLQQVQILIDLGIFTGSEKPIENLRTQVRQGFKPAYLTKL